MEIRIASRQEKMVYGLLECGAIISYGFGGSHCLAYCSAEYGRKPRVIEKWKCKSSRR